MRLGIPIVIMMCSLPSAWAQVHLRQTNVDIAAAEVRAGSEASDLIVVNPWYMGVSFNRYYVGANLWVTVPPLADLNIHRFDLLKQQMMARRPIEAVLRSIARTLRSGHRVWIINDLGISGSEWAVLSRQRHLAPAPDGGWGWQYAAYTLAWAAELDDFVRRHAARCDHYALPDIPVIPYEDVSIEILQGWVSATGATCR